MMMPKNLIDAIKALPAEWIREEVHVAIVGESVIFAHNNMIPLIWRNGEFTPMTFTEARTNEWIEPVNK